MDPTRSGNELPAGGCLQQPPALPVCPHTARGLESRGVWGPRAGRCMAPSAVRPAWSALRPGHLAGAPRERPSPSACSGPGTRLSPQQPGDFPFKVSEMGPCAAASHPGSHADPQPGAPRAVLSAHPARPERTWTGIKDTSVLPLRRLFSLGSLEVSLRCLFPFLQSLTPWEVFGPLSSLETLSPSHRAEGPSPLSGQIGSSTGSLRVVPWEVAFSVFPTIKIISSFSKAKILRLGLLIPQIESNNDLLSHR